MKTPRRVSDLYVSNLTSFLTFVLMRADQRQRESLFVVRYPFASAHQWNDLFSCLPNPHGPLSTNNAHYISPTHSPPVQLPFKTHAHPNSSQKRRSVRNHLCRRSRRSARCNFGRSRSCGNWTKCKTKLVGER
jgi:hypothetical protein